MGPSPVARPLRRAALGLATTGVLLLAPTLASAATSTDVQANNPQVAGSPTSNTTAVFPTNKQNETSVAVNPVAGNFLISGANDEQRQPPCGPGPVRGPDAVPSDCSFFPNVGTSGVYTSSDGGATWTNRGLLDDQQTWKDSRLVSDGDPVIMYGPKPAAGGGFTYDAGARAYYATLASYKDNVGPYPANKAPEFLAISFSDDNGLTWSSPVIATPNHPVNFNDKEWLAVDDNPASRYFGRLHMSWTQFRSNTSTGNGNEPVKAVYSADGGQTFSAPRQLSPAGNNGTGNGRQGSYVVTGPDGSVYVAFEQGSSQVVAISRDGGVSYARPTTIGPVVDIADPIPGANFRTNSFPTIAADPHNGSSTLYASWATRTIGGGRIVVSTSTDKGRTWSAPATVSTTAEGYAFYQGMDVAANGRVDLGYQALIAVDPTTYGTGNAAINSYYVSRSAGPSGVWSAATKVSSMPTDPAVSAQNNLARQFMGDYNQLVSTNDRAWFIYTDTRNGVGCPAVDQYQRIIDGTETVRGDFGDRLKTRLGQNPYAHEPGAKPAPPQHCGGSFGNSDAYVSVITP